MVEISTSASRSPALRFLFGKNRSEMRDRLPKPGELLALPEGKARVLFAKWLRDDELSDEIAMLSFEQHSEEVRKAGWLQARWHEDGDKTVSQFLSYDSVWDVNPFEIRAKRPMTRKSFAELREKIFRLLDLRRLARRAFIALSNGEMRRVLLARALLKSPKILFLDNPAAGMDPVQRGKLKDIILALCRRGMAVVMGYQYKDEVPIQGARHVATDSKRVAGAANGRSAAQRRPVVEITNLSLSFGGRKLFDRFSWTIREGERWVLRGENGTGKSTLLSLVNGDNPFAYACDIKVFGVARDSGAAIGGMRNRIGMASAEMQAYLGESPMALLDKALSPGHDLLLLDEPFMNMSSRVRAQARRKITAFLKSRPNVAAILVSHREDDLPPSFDLTMDFSLK